MGELRFPFAYGAEKEPCSSPQEPSVFSVSEGKYICHAHCRDLLHLDYPQNGKWPSCRSASEVRHSSRRNGQVGRRVNCSCSIQVSLPITCWWEEPMAHPGSLSGSDPCRLFIIISSLGAYHIRSATLACNFRNKTVAFASGFVTEHKALICQSLVCSGSVLLRRMFSMRTTPGV